MQTILQKGRRDKHRRDKIFVEICTMTYTNNVTALVPGTIINTSHSLASFDRPCLLNLHLNVNVDLGLGMGLEISMGLNLTLNNLS